jgi:hypothetical protein
VVRIFKLASGAADEYAFMFHEDYTAVVRQQQAALAARQSPAPQLAVFDWFLHSVVPACPEVRLRRRPGAMLDSSLLWHCTCNSRCSSGRLTAISRGPCLGTCWHDQAWASLQAICC